MPTLTSSWQEIARGSWYNGYGYEYCIMFACANEDVTANKSTVHTLLRISCDSNITVTMDSWSASLDGAGSTSGGSTTFSGGDTNILEGYFDVSHNADGTGGVTVHGSWNASFGLTAFNPSVSCGLQTIPRASNVSLNKSTVTLNGSDGFVIYTNRASSSFSHKLFQNISGSWVQIASGVGDNYTWIPSTNFYANIGNGSKTYQIRCETWSGGTHIGDSQVNFTLASAGVHQCSLSTGSITLNGSNGVRIYTNRNSGSFTHSVEQNFSGSMAAISNGYNVTDYIDWTPPASYYTTIGGGSKSFTIRVHCKNNDGTDLGYTEVSFTIYSAGADSVSLNNTNMTMGTAYTVSIAKRVSSFRHTVTWAFGSASGTLGTAKAVDTSVGWTPSTDLSAQILTAMTGQGTVTCQTYYGDTSIGSTSVAFNLSVPSYNVILGTPAITETGKDNTGTALTAKGIGATEVVAIMSIKRLVVSATTSYNATIKNISVSFGGSTKTVSSGSFDDTFSGMMNGNLTITATDSRGIALASTYSQSYTFRDYFKPSVTSFDGDRASQTGDTGTLNATGTFWNKTAGTTANVLAGAISISATGATTIVPAENKWTTAFDVSGVTYQNSYNFKIIVTDSFGFTAEKTYTLNASVPVLVKLKHTVRIYRNLIVSNIIKAAKGYFTGDLKVGGRINSSGNVTAPTFVGSLNGNATSATTATNATNATHANTADSAGSIPLDKIYPVGAIYLSVKKTSPAALFGGTWAELTTNWHYMLLGGSGSIAENGANTGGSLTTGSTALTIAQIPSHRHQSIDSGYCGNFSNGSGYTTGVANNYGESKSLYTTYEGGNQGHTHSLDWMPYIEVFSWKRIA